MISGYLSFLYKTHNHSGSGEITRCSLYYYGIGASIGKKVILSKDEKWFLDFGLGISNNLYHEILIFSTSDWSETYFGNDMLVRPILQIGKKFLI